MPLALYTFGLFIKPADDKSNDGFHQLNNPILELVDEAQGLIARSGYDGDPGPESWGKEVYPEFYKEQGDGWSPATLSLWEDMESLFSFTYSGLHAEALKRGREWFQKPEWPPLVMWWHCGNSFPTWVEGVRRHSHLHIHGPTPSAFTFKKPFDENENASTIDKARIQKLRNAIV